MRLPKCRQIHVTIMDKHWLFIYIPFYKQILVIHIRVCKHLAAGIFWWVDLIALQRMKWMYSMLKQGKIFEVWPTIWIRVSLQMQWVIKQIEKQMKSDLKNTGLWYDCIRLDNFYTGFSDHICLHTSHLEAINIIPELDMSLPHPFVINRHKMCGTFIGKN